MDAALKNDYNTATGNIYLVKKRTVFLLEITKTTKIFEDYGAIPVYGFKAECESGTQYYNDLSFNRRRVEMLIEKILLNDVHEYQLADVTRDFIAEEAEYCIS